jgi:hypothetical protein
VLCSLGRYDEAAEWGGKSRELGGSDDLVTQMLWRQVPARVEAHAGETAEAERLAREAVECGEQTDMLVNRAVGISISPRSSRWSAAAEEAGRALELFERKGDLPMVEQSRARLERLI